LAAEQDPYAEQSLHLCIAETQGGSSLPGDLYGPSHLFKHVFANRAIVGHSLDPRKGPVGLEADLPQSRQVL
jgi:hypothetical protein